MINLNKQSGFTVVELMVASLLGTILLLGATNLYMSTKQTFRITGAQSGLNENGRFAIDFISRDLRRAGSMGCLSDVAWYLKTETMRSQAATMDPTGERVKVLVQDPNNYVLKMIQGEPLGGIEAYEAGSPLIPAEFQALNPPPLPDTDILVVRGELGRQGVLTADFPGGNADMNVTPSLFKQNDVVMVTDCESAHVFQITNDDPNTGRLEHADNGGTLNNMPTSIDPKSPYMLGTPIVQISTAVYYVANDPVSGDPGLYRGFDGMAPEEAVPYVERFRVLLGENTDMSPQPTIPFTADRFVTPDQIAVHPTLPIGGNIVAAKISLLVRSPERFYQREDIFTRPYTLFGEVVNYQDEFKRKVYASTVILRNRAMR